MIQLPNKYAGAYQSHNQFAIIHGNQCRTWSDFYFQLKVALQLPDYFGNNLDALEEVLQDLSEEPTGKTIYLIITDFKLLCLDEPESKKNILLEILKEAESEHFKIITLG